MEITRLLRAAEGGDAEAREALYAAVYRELHAMAERHRRGWQGNETLNTTALVHEAYLKLARCESPDWSDRGHFFAVASRVMRQILMDYAERSQAAKRGGDAVEVPLANIGFAPPDAVEDLLALDRALAAMEVDHPRWVRVVECRFFTGLSVVETAEALGVSPATVKREWSQARVWLGRRLED